MKFSQSYSYFEHEHGLSTVLFVLSDTYSELYTSDTGIVTDVFLLNSVKKDLNLKDGSYALDELGFKINHLSCTSENDIKALYFSLDCTKLQTNRYCAVFFDSVAIENMLFCGKLATKVSADDIVWNENEEVLEDKSPLREYSFTALSFDFSIIEKVNLNSKIELADGTKIDSIYERFATENWDSLKAVTVPRLTFKSNIVSFPNRYFMHQINLYDTLNLFLNKTNEILSEFLDDEFSINLIESNIGIEVSPTKYYFDYSNIEDGKLKEPILESFNDRRIKLHIKNYDSDTESNIYFSRKMINPEFGIPSGTNKNILNAKNEASNQRNFSFLQYNNFGELLLEIARSFGLYVVFNYTTTNNLTVEFKTRSGIVEDEYTQIIGVSDAGFDTSSILIETPQKYYGQANSYSTDGIDETGNVNNTQNLDPSKALVKAKEERKQLLDRTGAKSAKTLFTTSQTISTIYTNTKDSKPYKIYPFNLHAKGDIPSDWDTLPYLQVLGEGTDFGVAIFENLHTGIYVKTNGIETEQILRLSGEKIFRPATNIYTRINGEDRHFHTLSEYVNEITSQELQWYQTEYSLEVSYWNGFIKDISKSWKNIKLGSKVKIGENVKRFVSGVWIENYVERDYVVVSIEFSLEEPKTKLKLHNIEKFAYGYFSGSTIGLPTAPNIQFINQPVSEENTIKNFEIDNVEISIGDVVMLSSDNKITKAVPKKENQSKIIGIALQQGSSNDTIAIQVAGRVSIPNYTFSNINKQVFCRKNDSDLNISESILESKTSEEDMIVVLGIIDSSNSFIINKKEFILE